MGAEHLVSDRQRVKAYLYDELNTTSIDDLMPKSTTFEHISQQQITKIMEKINNSPRAKLNFSTPKECFMKNIN